MLLRIIQKATCSDVIKVLSELASAVSHGIRIGIYYLGLICVEFNAFIQECLQPRYEDGITNRLLEQQIREAEAARVRERRLERRYGRGRRTHSPDPAQQILRSMLVVSQQWARVSEEDNDLKIMQKNSERWVQK